ncbi:MAG: PspA/IM30 family protein [Methermicoccaceae archaeon]
MGLFERMEVVVKSKVSKLLDRVEDPREVLDYSYEKQLDMLKEVKKGVVRVATSRKRLEIQKAKLEQMNEKLDRQAREAISVNREDLARLALGRKQENNKQILELNHEIEKLRLEEEKLSKAKDTLERKIEVFRARKETIKAKYSAVEARSKVSEAITGISEEMGDVGFALQRAEDKTEELDARTQALDELLDSGVLEDLTGSEDNIDKELSHISSEKEIEHELELLKKEAKK